MANSKLDHLQQWLQDHGIRWDRTAVSLRGGAPAETSFSVLALLGIPEGDTLCEIPKNAVLSVRNSAAADIIETEQLGGGLGLILAIMFELSLGAESTWHGYLQSLPAREYLPIFWQEEELALLQGTELAGKASTDRELTEEDWETHLLPLFSKYPALNQPGMSLDTFRAAASWVASRAFGVDSYHGMAMVPFADLFNHKAAVVQLGGGYFVEDVCFEGQESSDDQESEQGDSASDSDDFGSEGVQDSSDVESEGEEEAAENAVQPMTLEAERGGPTRGAMLDPSLQQDPKLRLEIGICGVTKPDGTEVLEIVAASDLSAGQEIMNTYGEHGNAELINKYGFALPDNPFDTVKLDKDTLLAQAEEQNGRESCQQRCAFMSEHSHLLEEDLEPFEVLPKGKIGPSLMMALRVLYAPQAQFASWTTLTDAMPSMVDADESSKGAQEASGFPQGQHDTRTDSQPLAGTSKPPTEVTNGSFRQHTDKQTDAASGQQSRRNASKKNKNKANSEQADCAEEVQHTKRHKSGGKAKMDSTYIEQASDVSLPSAAEQGEGKTGGVDSEEKNRDRSEQLGKHKAKQLLNGVSNGATQGASDGIANGISNAISNGVTIIDEARVDGNSLFGKGSSLTNVNHNSDSNPDSVTGLPGNIEQDSDTDNESQQAAEQLSNVDIAGVSSRVLNEAMLKGLQQALQARLALYSNSSINEDSSARNQVQAGAVRQSREARQAMQAALLLCTAEKSLLHDATAAAASAICRQKQQV